MSTTSEILTRLGACGRAVEWAQAHPDPREAYQVCPRGDWLAWLWGRAAQDTADGSPEHRRAACVTVLCAWSAVHLVTPAHREAVEEALWALAVWALGGPDRRRWAAATCRRAAAYVAYTADADYAADAANYAAVVAADYAVVVAVVADAANYAADAAAYAADAADAADSADSALAYAAGGAHLAALADQIRAVWPEPPEALL